MIRALRQYMKDEVLPRIRSILIASDFAIAVLLAAATGLWGDRTYLADAKIGDIVAALLTYAAIAFGFCLSGLTVALTLPDVEFVRHLASSKPTRAKFDAYSDLMFVFSWTALVHWVDVLAMVLVLMLVGSEKKILPNKAVVGQRIVVGALVFFLAYGIFQFMNTLITLSQVGRAYVFRLSKPSTK